MDKTKPRNCSIYLDQAAQDNGGPGNLYYWTGKYNPSELSRMGLKRVGVRKNGEDVMFDGERARAFEEYRKSVDVMDSESFGEAWGML